MAKFLLRMVSFVVVGFVLGACQPAASSSSEESLSSSAPVSSSTVSSSLTSLVPNKDKPLAFFSRLPSLNDGTADTATLTFNDKTFYVGFDFSSEGTLQGELITDYFAGKRIADVDRNGDGYFGYVLFVGDDGNELAQNRTGGIRRALGTFVYNRPDGSISGATHTQEGTLVLKDGSLKVKEFVSEPMLDSTTGAYWSSEAAQTKTASWVQTYGQKIDGFISNSDGMALGALSSSAYPSGVPLFGFGGTSAALAQISGGAMTGTVVQPFEDVAAGTLEVLRSGFEGLSTGDIAQKGFSLADAYGNEVTSNFSYYPANREILFCGSKVTSANVASYIGPAHDPHFSHAATGTKVINLWIDYYNPSESIWEENLHDAFVYYAGLLNIKLNLFSGDGSTEASLTDYFTDLEKYDAYAVNPVHLTNGSMYTNLLNA